ncbi:MAG: hypothetical protein ACXADD_13840 [Candidatus Thorarchaeota archaeon]
MKGTGQTRIEVPFYEFSVTGAETVGVDIPSEGNLSSLVPIE